VNARAEWLPFIAGLLLGALLMQPWGSVLSGGERVVILGVNETGKSFTAEKLTEDAHRVLWMTPEEEDYSAPGRLELTVPELRRYHRLLADPHLRLVLRLSPEETTGEGAREALSAVRQLCREYKDLVWVLDETGDLKDSCEDILRAIFRRDRHRGVTAMLIGQTATDIPLRCLKLASRVLCLGQAHEGELQLMADVWGEAFAERVRAWRQYDPPVEWRPAFKAGAAT
jgi:hypothetical protein